MYLKKASLDLGKKFTQRVFLYSSVFLICYGLMAAFFTLTFFGLIKNDTPIEVMILGYFDVVVVLGIIIKMLSVGAKVNSYFTINKGLFIKLKTNFIDLNTRYDEIIDREKFESKTLQMLRDHIKRLNLNADARKEHIDS